MASRVAAALVVLHVDAVAALDHERIDLRMRREIGEGVQMGRDVVRARLGVCRLQRRWESMRSWGLLRFSCLNCDRENLAAQ